MINKKIAMSAMSIVAALTLAGGATFAFFSDEATRPSNTFGTASMDLELANDGVTFLDDVTATFSVSNMIPGQIRAQTITFRNNGTTPIAEIAMKLDATSADDSSPDGSDLRNVLNVRVFEGSTADGTNTSCTGGTEVTSTIETAVQNNGTPLTFTDWNGDTYDSLSLPIPVGLSTQNLCVAVELEPTANNDYQGDSANATFTFVAHQSTTQ